MGTTVNALRAAGAEAIRPKHDDKTPPPPPEPTLTEERQKITRIVWATYQPQLMPWKVLTGAVIGGLFVHAQGYGWSTLMLILILAAAGYLFTEWRLTWHRVGRRKLEWGKPSGRKLRRINRRAWRSARVGAGIGVWLTLAAVTDPAGWSGQIVWLAGALVWALVSNEGWWRPADTSAGEYPDPVVPDDDYDDAVLTAPVSPGAMSRPVRGGVPVPSVRPARFGRATAGAAAPAQVQLPDPVLLKVGPSAAKLVIAEDFTDAIQLKLDELGIKARVVGNVRSPRITRYEIEPDGNQTVDAILRRARDFAMVCKTKAVRILAPIEGQSRVGIEVPNREKTVVPLGEVLASSSARASHAPLLVGLGMDTDGKVLVYDLAKAPHILVAGSTNSGKSGCLNSMLVSVLTRATPDEVKLLLIDPKQVELTPYDGIEHLLHRVITDPSSAANALEFIEREMDLRYDDMRANRVRNIDEYNVKFDRGEIQAPPGSKREMKRLARWLAVIDELADLITSAHGKEIEASIVRIGQLARAAGIHMVLATQRPSVDVVTGLIKANVPSRLAFAVASGGDSRVILDENGAEKLLGEGDGFFLPMGTSEKIRFQGCWVEEEQRDAVIAHWRAQRGVTGHTVPAIALDVPRERPAQGPTLARDIVLAAARRLADHAGEVDKPSIVAVTPAMVDATRDAAIGVLHRTGELTRIKNGRYKVLPEGEQPATPEENQA